MTVGELVTEHDHVVHLPDKPKVFGKVFFLHLKYSHNRPKQSTIHQKQSTPFSFESGKPLVPVNLTIIVYIITSIGTGKYYECTLLVV